MSSPTPSATFAESLSIFSKAAYQAVSLLALHKWCNYVSNMALRQFADVEARSRLEVARMCVELREAKADRDKAVRELHVFQLEAQGWKQEIVSTKAALSQAELTIAHQAETLAGQIETITQLRREVTQWKDQSRNWQEHFLRVEQERCAQSSRIDELVVEKLQPQRVSSAALQTPKSMKYSNTSNSAPSSKGPLETTVSPTQAPAPPSPSSLDSPTVIPGSQPGSGTNPQRRKRRAKSHIDHERDVRPLQAGNDRGEGSSTGVKRVKKNLASSVQQSAVPAALPKEDAPATIRSSTVIRRVQAVVHVKREESCSGDEAFLRDNVGIAPTYQNVATTSTTTIKKKEESEEYQRYLRTPRRKIIEDESEDEEQQNEDEQEIDAQIVDSGSGAWPDAGRPRQQSGQRRFRQRNRINYKEDGDSEVEEDEDEDEDDELMMGAEDNHEEVYGTQRVETNHDNGRSKKHAHAVPTPIKRRKVHGR
ncbi:hypothetical protein JR316_0006913 [Psilocybe cubensis]|uniref:Uncharacterized protein n=2 Tax=Psilocybe cubensis TaxID=181762 RepID=A0A8H8CLD0_PSICU|nr:hypothetical protein JR316_0006913 [Psilocybe cubensis]KAH9480315.1 hypothetical protein JR316_0006913 [Psilocybe cubensis]